MRRLHRRSLRHYKWADNHGSLARAEHCPPAPRTRKHKAYTSRSRKDAPIKPDQNDNSNFTPAEADDSQQETDYSSCSSELGKVGRYHYLEEKYNARKALPWYPGDGLIKFLEATRNQTNNERLKRRVDERLPVWIAVVELGLEQWEDLLRLQECIVPIEAERQALAELIAAEEKQGQSSSTMIEEMRAKQTTQQQEIESFHRCAHIGFEMLKRTLFDAISDLTKEHEEQRRKEQFPLRAIPKILEPQESEPAAEKPNPSEYTYVEACEEAMELWLGFVEAPKMVSLIRKSCQYREIDELPNDELTCTDIRSFWTWLISPITDKTLKVPEAPARKIASTLYAASRLEVIPEDFDEGEEISSHLVEIDEAELEDEYTIQSHYIDLKPGEEDSWAEEEKLSSDAVSKDGIGVSTQEGGKDLGKGSSELTVTVSVSIKNVNKAQLMQQADVSILAEEVGFKKIQGATPAASTLPGARLWGALKGAAVAVGRKLWRRGPRGAGQGSVKINVVLH